MKRTLKNLIANAFVAALLTIAILPTAAQPPRDPETAAKHQTERMQKELSLTEAQRAKVQQLNLAYAKKQQALSARQAEERTKRRESRKALQQEKEAQLKTLLTEAQWKQYEQKKQERGPRRPHHHRNRSVG
jgi:predicted RNA-binding protein with RPS1 domain